VAASNKLHEALSAVGIIAWSVFILGCAMGSIAWSPDGSKIAFAYHDPVAKADGVMIYDRVRNSLTPAYVANGSDDEGPLIQTQWDQTGSRLLVAIYQEDKNKVEHFDLLALSEKSQHSVRHFILSLPDDMPMLPVPQKGPRLFLSGEQLVILNLDTGEMQSNDRFANVALYPAGDRILYRRKSYSAAARDKITGIEFGFFDPDALALHSSFTVLQTELDARGISNLVALAVLDTGREFAAVGQRNQAQDVIVLFNENGIDRILTPQLPVQQPFKLGSVVWGRNGNIYAAVAIRDGDVAQYAIAEIPLAGGTVRLIPIARVNWDLEASDFVDAFSLTSRIAVSPDGRTLAATTTALREKEITVDDRALFLIDLADRTRKVTRIPMSAHGRGRKVGKWPF
jgi:hypothetical protein